MRETRTSVRVAGSTGIRSDVSAFVSAGAAILLMALFYVASLWPAISLTIAGALLAFVGCATAAGPSTPEGKWLRRWLPRDEMIDRFVIVYRVGLRDATTILLVVVITAAALAIDVYGMSKMFLMLVVVSLLLAVLPRSRGDSQTHSGRGRDLTRVIGAALVLLAFVASAVNAVRGGRLDRPFEYCRKFGASVDPTLAHATRTSTYLEASRSHYRMLALAEMTRIRIVQRAEVNPLTRGSRAGEVGREFQAAFATFSRYLEPSHRAATHQMFDGIFSRAAMTGPGDYTVQRVYAQLVLRHGDFFADYAAAAKIVLFSLGRAVTTRSLVIATTVSAALLMLVSLRVGNAWVARNRRFGDSREEYAKFVQFTVFAGLLLALAGFGALVPA